MIDGVICGREFPVASSRGIASLGHDVVTTFEDGRANQSVTDRELLERATEIGRTVLTLNRSDFKRLHVQLPEHAGIIICTEDPDRVGQARRISESIAGAGKLAGQLIRVYRPG